VLQDDVQEVPGVQPLALQPALHVGDGDEHGVHLAVVDQVTQVLHGEDAVLAVSQGSPRRRAWRASWSCRPTLPPLLTRVDGSGGGP
jgi:hypothetical protein